MHLYKTGDGFIIKKDEDHRVVNNIDDWNSQSLEDAVRSLADARELKLGQIAQPLRAALCGSTVSPGIFEVAAALGREETLGRLEDIVGASS